MASKKFGIRLVRGTKYHYRNMMFTRGGNTPQTKKVYGVDRQTRDHLVGSGFFVDDLPTGRVAQPLAIEAKDERRASVSRQARAQRAERRSMQAIEVEEEEEAELTQEEAEIVADLDDLEVDSGAVGDEPEPEPEPGEGFHDPEAEASAAPTGREAKKAEAVARREERIEAKKAEKQAEAKSGRAQRRRKVGAKKKPASQAEVVGRISS